LGTLEAIAFFKFYMLKKARIVLALLCWLSVTLLFLDLTGATRAWIGWLAKIQFLPAVLAMNIGVVVLWVVLTLLVGRIYCSVICPLGVFQDFFSHLGDVVHRKTTKKKI
jgi:polyferredoxin